METTFHDVKKYNFTSPEPLPLHSKNRTNELLNNGRLFRYQDVHDVSNLEKEFAKYIGSKFTIACNSGGCAIFLALKALGVQPGDPVLTCSHTLAPVPGAIVHANAKPIFVNTNPKTLSLCLKDLKRKITQTPKASILVVSYMRGRVPDIDEMMSIASEYNIQVVEDCAHTFGATWSSKFSSKPKHIGTFGTIGCWSLQTNKAINSGEGGLISTNRTDLAAYLTVATGSYGHFGLNGASPSIEYLSKVYTSIPNFSMRLNSIAAAIALPQLVDVDRKVLAWKRNMTALRSVLDQCKYISIMNVDSRYQCAWSSIQFHLIHFNSNMIATFINRSKKKYNIPIAWFGADKWNGFTSTLKDWKFADSTGKQWDDSEQEHFTSNLIDIPLYHTTLWEEKIMILLGKLLVSVIENIVKEEEQGKKEIAMILASESKL